VKGEILRECSGGISSISISNWPDINNLSSVWVFCLHVDSFKWI
jgi:hypothetical protein